MQFMQVNMKMRFAKIVQMHRGYSMLLFNVERCLHFAQGTLAVYLLTDSHVIVAYTLPNRSH